MKFLKEIKKLFPNRLQKAFSDEERSRFIQTMRATEVFSGFTEEMITKMLSIMEPVFVNAGDVVIKQGEEGDYYYLIVRGTARVTQRASPEIQQRIVAELTPPASIGEDALISNAKRNATVIMTSDGMVLRLAKECFYEHVRNPILKWVSPSEVRGLLAEGAKWLDVREQKKETLHGAVNIPFSELRARIPELDREIFYLCCCDNGRLSASAAFVLCQRGLKAGVLRGGLTALHQSRS